MLGRFFVYVLGVHYRMYCKTKWYLSLILESPPRRKSSSKWLYNLKEVYYFPTFQRLAPKYNAAHVKRNKQTTTKNLICFNNISNLLFFNTGIILVCSLFHPCYTYKNLSTPQSSPIKRKLYVLIASSPFCVFRIITIGKLLFEARSS